MAFPSASAIEAFIATQLDYIVIGGGVAGLPIANRLTEDPSVKVGILEAGLSFQDDPLIDIPRNVALNNGNPKYDWMLSTSPQFGAAERSIMIFRGKGLGGSSVLNYMAWDRGSKEEYDAWNALVDGDGWNWDSILPFLVKVEDALPATINPDLALRYSASEAHVLDRGIPRDEAVGSGGPVKIRYNELNTDVTSPYVKAWNILGQRTNSNPWGGDASGLYSGRLSIDEHGKRVTATSAYYTPVASRPNLSLLTGAQVTKILFESELVDGNRVAIGVEFTVDGKIYTVSVSKEVILSAGVIQTPQILELSGVGDSKRLEGMGITTLVHLPGVGENLHDHPFSSIHYQAKSGVMTYDELSKNAEFAAAEKERYEKSGQGWMASNDSVFVFTALDKILDASVLSAKIKKVEEAIDAEKNNPSANQLTLKQHSIQLDWLKKGGVPHMEFILFSGGLVKPDPNASYFVITSGLQHPFSRGCVHIQSTDPLQAPLIDPGYLTHEFDVFSLLAGYRAVEKLAQTPPLVDIISQQIVPATTLSDEEVIQYIRQGCVSGAHQMGTAAMARRDLGGVVGSNLKVHGTANLRVADASIIPLPVAAHIQATVYAIGEKV
ncbi:alcohol oxidase [Mycena metata]|uniref:Alcohol oxidase n=1 Tax=Mycena metata TaxID=1033252 RepID=A0AAD7JHG3_9AGAR|nr:alcohol oxidase [Mycena metata]